MKTSNHINITKRVSKNFSFFIFLFSLIFASCTKSEEATINDNATTFTLSVNGDATRAVSTITPARYIMEVWSEDGSTAENVFGTGATATNQSIITTGNTFTVTLDKSKAYTCLFWADDNTTFNATSLKAIGLNVGKTVNEAYFSKVAVASGSNPAVAVTLKRAVAKIVLTETATVDIANDIALKISNIYPTFNVLDAQASGTAAEWTKTIKPAAATGVIGTFYFFAKADKELSDLKFTYATETEKTVSNIPVQQNHATNIKGEYSNVSSYTFNVTADDAWSTPDNNVNLGTKVYKVGDVFPNATAPIGIVFWVDESDETYDATDKTSAKGKIVSLDEATNKQWSTENVNTGASSVTSGAENTSKVLALSTYSAAKYPAFAWCASKNTPAITGINWYIPATKELRMLYAAMCGLKWVDGTAGAGEIRDWGNDASMPDYGTYADACIAFNGKLTAASGTVIDLSGATYWASNISSDATAWLFYFSSSFTTGMNKNSGSNVRAISAF